MKVPYRGNVKLISRDNESKRDTKRAHYDSYNK
jgi:hypothetical protein